MGNKNNLLACFGKTEFSQFCCGENTEKIKPGRQS
jgi:hypothetical protein